MTVKRTWTVENKWICTSCRAENLGRYMECQTCRSPKEKDEKDILSGPTASEVKDPELLRLAGQRANWVCEFCGGQVRDEHGKCVKNCGAPRPQPEENSRARPRATPAPDAPAPARARQVPRPPPTTVPGPGVPRYPSAAKKDFPWWIVGVLAGGGALVALLTFLLVPKEVDAKVNSIRWMYTSDLRQKTLMHGEGWGSPSGSFNVSCSRKYYGDEDCNPHDCNPHSVSYECNCQTYDCNCRTTCSDNGNGFSTCSESCSTCSQCSTCSRTEYDTCYDRCPVYKDYCTYDYYEWPVVASQKTGSFEHDEKWPDLQASGPDQRLDRTEYYEVVFIEAKTGKENWTYKPKTLPEFKTFDSKQLWRIKVNRLGSVTPLQRTP